MTCPQCGIENPPKFKFCVKCGSNLENPQEINIEQIAMGGYHSEEDSDSGGFKIGSGTFVIKDRPPANSSAALYTADELNDTDEEFDFSSFDEPPPPKPAVNRPPQPEPQNQYAQPVQQPNMYGYHQNNMYSAPFIQPAAPQQPMNGFPQTQPGAMGMPVYGQPMMYAQPQIIGYDPSGMPIYGQPQPMMYAQAQVIGYDPSGMPIYGQPQPMMYAQPQIIGYDPSGMPIYGQLMMYPQQPVMNDMGDAAVNPYQQPMPYPNMQPMQGAQSIPAIPSIPAVPQTQNPQNNFQESSQPAAQPEQTEDDQKLADTLDKFWEFFNEGKTSDKSDGGEPDNDFFGKHGSDTAAAPEDSISGLKRFEHKKDSEMTAAPIADANDLAPNTAAKFNKMYMKQTDTVNADDLEAKLDEKPSDIMGVTRDVDASDLAANEKGKNWVLMGGTEKADPETLEAYVPEHKSALMAQADHAVEAMPKKKTTYNDEIDAIELPEYMQSKKTVKNDIPQIPDLPDMPNK